MEWFPWYPALYKADTMHLTLAEDGAYRRLIDHYMETQAPLPNNEKALARILGISVNEFQAIAEQVSSMFSTSGGHLHNKRCDIELERQESLSKKRSEAGKNGARKRHKKQQDTSKCSAKPEQTVSTGQDKTGQDIEKHICGAQIAFDAYNVFAEENGLPKACKLTASRKSKLTARLKDVGGIDGWKAALDKASKLSGLMGADGGWKADLDFFLKESKFIKLMEGSYDSWSADGQDGKLTGFHAVAAELAK